MAAGRDKAIERLANCDAEFQVARKAYQAASLRRNAAMVSAVNAGAQMKEVAARLGVTHEAVRKVVRAAEV
jgi:predicted transcriptional regulator